VSAALVRADRLLRRIPPERADPVTSVPRDPVSEVGAGPDVAAVRPRSDHGFVPQVSQ
jgi:hypothetical protein